jgi:hypothetical protein
VDLDCRAAHRILRVERGSAIIEGAVAVGLSFLLLAVVVQVAFAATARNTAEAAVAASARRAARPGWSLESERAALARIIERTVPGAAAVSVSLARTDDRAVARVAFRWRGPGPSFVPLRIAVESSALLVVPP